jgi:HPt (histidine-containing phosphotransfer) domain-containing protein
VHDHALDPDVISALRALTTDGDSDVVNEVLTLFRDSAPERIAAISQACRSGDAVALQRTAHDFKGASGTIGAFGLQQCCKELELAAKSGSLSRAEMLLVLLRAEYARVDAAIGEVLGRRS